MQVTLCAYQEPSERAERSRWRWMRMRKLRTLATITHLLIISFLSGAGIPGAVQRIQLLERRFGPDTEAAHVTTGRDLEQVQALHVDEGGAGDVAESARDAVVLRVDDERSATLDATPVAHLTLASTETTAVLHLQQ